jgi:putative ubiquitin-RnfH superfamily antitoxin RatB of RatAB toxin-antitoxin module
MPNKFWIELVYALPSQQKQYRFEVLEHTTVQHALEVSGVLQDFPELQQQELMLGIWGKRVSLQQVLKPDDRIEIYRPLLLDPKQARQVKVMRERKKKMQKNFKA